MTPRGDDTPAPKGQATFASPEVSVIPFWPSILILVKPLYEQALADRSSSRILKRRIATFRNLACLGGIEGK